MTATVLPAEFVTVPAAVLGPVLDTHIGQMLRGDLVDPRVQTAFAEVFPGGQYRDLPDPVRISAESAFWLAFHADAETLYGAGAEDRASAAIHAEFELFAAVDAQAPATAARLDRETDAAFNAASTAVYATVTDRTSQGG